MHKIQVQILITSVKFVSDDRMTNMRKMNSNLVFATGQRGDTQQRKISLRPAKPALEGKFRARSRAIWTHSVLNRDLALLIFAKSPIDQTRRCVQMPMHDCQVLLEHIPFFPNATQLHRDGKRFAQENQAAGFAIQSVDQMRLPQRANVEA